MVKTSHWYCCNKFFYQVEYNIKLGKLKSKWLTTLLQVDMLSGLNAINEFQLKIDDRFSTGVFFRDIMIQIVSGAYITGINCSELSYIVIFYFI